VSISFLLFLVETVTDAWRFMYVAAENNFIVRKWTDEANLAMQM
jgi:hypothetical protein